MHHTWTFGFNIFANFEIASTSFLTAIQGLGGGGGGGGTEGLGADLRKLHRTGLLCVLSLSLHSLVLPGLPKVRDSLENPGHTWVPLPPG